MNSPLPVFPLATIAPEDEALRAPVRAFLREALSGVPADVRARSWFGFDVDFSRELARRGWLGLTLPREYGGAGRSGYARFVVLEELLNAGAPVSAHWVGERQTAPLILRFGTEAQRCFYVPKIIAAEAFFCIGMSEPDTGSDLASVRTRATRTAAGWRLNGRKIWTTNAHHSQYMCALVRTSGTSDDRHKGLSQVIVDLSLPGVSIRPIRDISGSEHFAEVLFEDVELGEDALIGEEGAGWQQVNAELAFERSGPERVYSTIALADLWLAQVRAHGGAQNSALRALAGRIAGNLAVLRSMSLSVAGMLDRHERPDLEAAFVKDLGTGFEQAMPEWIAAMLDLTPDLPAMPELLRTLAYIRQFSPTCSLRGGTRQIMRGIIARGLGLR